MNSKRRRRDAPATWSGGSGFSASARATLTSSKRATTTSEMRCFSWMETYEGDVAEASMADAGAGGLDRGDLCEGSRVANAFSRNETSRSHPGPSGR
jgi:hypothetical protein